ncbi:hypothetical protein [Pusillimonas sp. ANT_WB101]|uniref:hypothetical protein n=1 Tax=Pusillimonas sp. ANT_WB101 TaxID=2597356 RepID=UPI0011ED234F|nr:hypothetical protein [Pusillimonas sp. ANT_WB101]KAA0892486.1 hypothetical protein FQ179_09175 [Pusillimonas sp. ANT_WB101]
MPLYEMTGESLSPVNGRTFTDFGLTERQNLQRAIRVSIDAITPDPEVKTMVLAEEFGDWVGANRRIDLLCLDENANLVVVELKRESATHMELQALRYAAMISTMRFDQAVQAHAKYLESIGSEGDAEQSIREFLGVEDGPVAFSEKVRIVLAASEFNSEVTTTVLWLNEQGLDIRCVQLRPHDVDGRVLVDIQQIIPLPEATSYQVALREKTNERVVARSNNRDMTRYDLTIGDQIFTNLPKRRLMYEITAEMISRGVTPEQMATVVPWKSSSMFAQADGTLDKSSFIKLLPKYQIDRCYTDDKDLFHLNEKTFALTKMWGDRTIEAIEAITSLNPNGRQIDFEPAITGTTEASYKDYLITRLSTGPIKLERDGLPIERVLPELRRLAGELNVSTANKQGNPHNTQVLGRELIKAINAL